MLQLRLNFIMPPGHKPPDIGAVIEALLRLSQLLIDFTEIRELDINPLRVFQENNFYRALDARIMICLFNFVNSLMSGFLLWHTDWFGTRCPWQLASSRCSHKAS